MHFGDTEFPKWLDADYLNKAADELKAMHERNQKLADAIVLPTNFWSFGEFILPHPAIIQAQVAFVLPELSQPFLIT